MGEVRGGFHIPCRWKGMCKGPEAGRKEHGNVRNEECGYSLVKERMRGNEARKVCRGWIIQDSQATRISSNFLF